MDSLPSRFMSELPEEGVQKNEEPVKKFLMILILIKIIYLMIMKNIEVQAGKDLKKLLK